MLSSAYLQHPYAAWPLIYTPGCLRPEEADLEAALLQSQRALRSVLCALPPAHSWMLGPRCLCWDFRPSPTAGLDRVEDPGLLNLWLGALKILRLSRLHQGSLSAGNQRVLLD